MVTTGFDAVLEPSVSDTSRPKTMPSPIVRPSDRRPSRMALRSCVMASAVTSRPLNQLMERVPSSRIVARLGMPFIALSSRARQTDLATGTAEQPLLQEAQVDEEGPAPLVDRDGLGRVHHPLTIRCRHEGYEQLAKEQTVLGRRLLGAATVTPAAGGEPI